MPSQPPSLGKCAYRFRHPNRPREYCGRPVGPNCQGGDERLPTGRRACLWHCRCDHATREKQTATDLVRQLERTLNEDEDRHLEGAYLRGAHLVGADLSDANLRYADFQQAQLQHAKLGRACLERADLGGACLEYADLSEAHLEDAALPNASLKHAILNRTHLYAAALNGAHMEGANLTYAYLEHANLQCAHLNRARLLGAGLDRRSNSEGTDWGVPTEEHDGDWAHAAAVYRMIGHHYAEKGNHEEAHKFYLREMTCHHRDILTGARPSSGSWDKVKGWVCDRLRRPLFARGVWCLHKYFWGYGVMPWRVFCWMVVVVAAFAIAFKYWGVACGSGAASHCFQDALALSLITFSTLGYGDWVPKGDPAHLLAGFEAVAGALLAAAFLVSLATKYVHRD